MLMLGARHAVVHLVLVLVSVFAVGSVACTIGEDRYETVKLPPVVHSEIRTWTCKFFLDGSPGACVSMVIKQVRESAGILQQDSCAADERCLPCIDPRNGKDLQICNLPGGPHRDACTGGAGADDKACCHGMGVCSKAEAMPPAQAKHMSEDTCPADHLCMPASLANGKTVTCDVLGFSGVCTDLCFATMFQATTQITRSSCGPTELCLPCAIAKMGAGDLPMPGCD